MWPLGPARVCAVLRATKQAMFGFAEGVAHFGARTQLPIALDLDGRVRDLFGARVGRSGCENHMLMIVVCLPRVPLA